MADADTYVVIIIGASIAGCIAAVLYARYGAKVALLGATFRFERAQGVVHALNPAVRLAQLSPNLGSATN
jgi:2-polyprenyl-6-methoxyphenol hydroxylase-like FAD-dependent oxidoreductase